MSIDGAIVTALAEIIRAVAALAWPLIVLAVALLFRPQIRDILVRLRRGKLFGQELELERSLTELHAQAETTALVVPENIQHEVVNHVPKALSEEDTRIRQILDDATRSPKIALIALAVEIEREVRHLLWSMGLHGAGGKPIAFKTALDTLVKHELIPMQVRTSIDTFWQVRNQLVHGYSADADNVVRAIDAGLRILDTLQKIPRGVFVYHPGVEVYSDSQGRHEREGVRSVILETLGEDGRKRQFVYPTTKTNYAKGERATWEWSNQTIYGETWYRDPDSGEIKSGWSSSMEFVGRHKEEI